MFHYYNHNSLKALGILYGKQLHDYNYCITVPIVLLILLGIPRFNYNFNSKIDKWKTTESTIR